MRIKSYYANSVEDGMAMARGELGPDATRGRAPRAVGRKRHEEPVAMRIKSYYANSVEDGMAMARVELGPDAMLVNSRRTAPEMRHLGDYEIEIVTDLAAADIASPPAAMAASGGLARPWAAAC